MTNYSLEDYTNIIFSGYEYKLPENILTIIKKLTIDLGINPVATSPVSDGRRELNKDSRYNKLNKPYNSNGKRNKQNGNKRHDINEETWDKIKSFKSTHIEKKEGIDKSINDIRICLNKISIKNYNIQRDSIIELILPLITEINSDTDSVDDEVESDDTKVNELNQITTALFDIASTNKFYSELYATLYKELTVKFPTFLGIMDGFTQQYMDNIKNIQLVDQDVDYDKFCDNNKKNDKRKAMTSFIVNLMKNGIIEKDVVLDMIINLQNIVINYIDEENKLNEVEEITENIFIFVTMTVTIPEILNMEKWTTIVENIKICSQMKLKEHTSISSRAIFKFLDILYNVEKSQNQTNVKK